LVVSLTKLHNAYEKFREFVDFEHAKTPEQPLAEFIAEIQTYLKVIDDLMARGADAYLTLELDERLQNFHQFLRRSVTAAHVGMKVVLESNLALPFAPTQFSLSRTLRVSPGARLPMVPGFRVALGGISFRYVSMLLSAPLSSREFESRFQTDVVATKILIKDVTLGSRNTSG